MKTLSANKNFLGISEPELCNYRNAKFVIQSIPYEHTSSYLQGSAKGPAAIIEASQFVEFYDETLDEEVYRKNPIATLEPMKFGKKVNADAVAHIEEETKKLLKDKKFVVSLGAEHTITVGLVKAHMAFYKNISVLQLDAHSDLRDTYHNNKYSHASAMARVHELGVPLTQIGIRAQSMDEAKLIKSSMKIHTFYAHKIKENPNWMNVAVDTLNENVYITVDADGFDPSIVPAVGTAEPNGLLWHETIEFLHRVFKKKKVIGFDIVECAPIKGQILSEYLLAKLAYRMIAFASEKK